jgi:hypothetical protein
MTTGAGLRRESLGRWEGTIALRGDTAPIRLEILEEGGGPQALLDLPDLVLAREPAPLTVREDGSIQVELPFGIGSIPLALLNGRLAGFRPLGEDRISIELRRDMSPKKIRRDLVLEPDGAVLRGTLVLPPGAGPHPAVVLLHGSDKPSRADWSYRSWADAMADRGVAALAFDRRGSEPGSGTPPDLGDLAADAAAWVERLRTEAGIRPDAVGLMGGSQAGWVAPLAASRSDSVAFLVLTSPPAVPPSEQEIQSTIGRAREEGVAEEGIRRLRSYLRLYFFVASTGHGWDLLRAEIERGAWSGLADAPERPEQLAWWKRNGDLDPATVLPSVHVPVLAAWGAGDIVVPADLNAARLEHLLRSGGNERVEAMILERADHRLELPMGNDAAGRWRWPRIAPAFLERLGPWITGVSGSTGAPGSPGGTGPEGS